MRKFYTFLVAGLALISAPNTVASTQIASFQKNDAHAQVKVRTAAQKCMSMKAPARSSEYDTYSWELKGQGEALMHALEDTYGLTPSVETVDVYEAKGHEGVYKIVGIWTNMVNDGTMIIDASDPDYIMVPTQSTGVQDSEDGETFIASQSYLMPLYGYTQDEVKANTSIMMTFEGNKIMIPKDALLLNWPNATEDSEYETDPDAWYYTAESSSYVTLPLDGEIENPWVELQEAQFKENLMYGLFVYSGNTSTENKNYLDVEAYQNSNDPTQYRIMNPLKATYAALNIEGESPMLTLDATDPSNISVELTSAGVYSSSDGTYYYFSESWYNANYGEGLDATEDEIRIKLENDGEYSTITFPYQCVSVLGNSSGQFYYGSPYESVLRFKTAELGVDNLNADSESGEAVYYNLQGVRTARPESGIAIRVQNGKATKILVK